MSHSLASLKGEVPESIWYKVQPRAQMSFLFVGQVNKSSQKIICNGYDMNDKMCLGYKHDYHSFTIISVLFQRVNHKRKSLCP